MSVETKPPALAQAPAFAAEVLAAQATIRAAGLPISDVLTQPIAEARARTNQFQAFLNQGGPSVDSVTELVLEGTTPPLRLRIYRPAAPGPLPAYLHIHGGGFAIGALDSLDRWKREIVRDSGMIVIGLDYALAPEHPYPTAIHQVLAALRWMRDHAASHGIDGTRLAVGGDSAGGNLALNALLRLRDAGEAGPLFGAIIYGMLSAQHDTPSHRDLGDGRFGLSTSRLDWFWSRYLPPTTAQRQDPGAAPLHAEMAGLPPLLLLAAGLDPLLDDTLNLAPKLQAAGVAHELLVIDGVPHGFIGQTALLPQANTALQAVVAGLKRHLGQSVMT